MGISSSLKSSERTVNLSSLAGLPQSCAGHSTGHSTDGKQRNGGCYRPAGKTQTLDSKEPHRWLVGFPNGHSCYNCIAVILFD